MAIKDVYFTMAEAAKELNVSRQTIYRWIADKKFPIEKMITSLQECYRRTIGQETQD